MDRATPLIALALALASPALALPPIDIDWDPPGVPNVGDSDYCSVVDTCSVGQGDCDYDSDCPDGVCRMDVGAAFGFSAATDVCWHPWGSWSYCSFELPCAEGVGDCDYDSDCEPTLECGQNRGGEYGWSSSFDVCVPGAGTWSYCSPSAPCETGEGDCDTDADCEAGTVCTMDVGERFGWSSGLDVCLPPEGSAFDAELALHHAPVHYQDTDDTCEHADYLTAVDYDGNLVGTDNWDNLFDHDLSGAAYYSVVESCTHWFVVYGMFHPRDWADGTFDQEHENDLEGLVLILQKEDGGLYGQLQAAITVFHLDFFSYTRAGSGYTYGAEDLDGTISYQTVDGVLRAKTTQEAKGHGLKMWPDAGDFQGDDDEDGVIYYPTLGAGEVPASGDDRSVLYRLIDLHEPGGLWEQAMVDAADSAPLLYHDFRSMQGDEGGSCGDGITITCSSNAANMPWGWDDSDSWPITDGDGSIYSGELALDPAHVLDHYFGNVGALSLNYLHNAYLEDLHAEGYSNANRPSGMSSDIDLDAMFGRLVDSCP